jgi:hypothetical protein
MHTANGVPVVVHLTAVSCRILMRALGRPRSRSPATARFSCPVTDGRPSPDLDCFPERSASSARSSSDSALATGTRNVTTAAPVIVRAATQKTTAMLDDMVGEWFKLDRNDSTRIGRT